MEKALQNLTHSPPARNYTYIYNHGRIMQEVESAIDDGYLPTITELAERTGLSRQTIYAHISEIPYYNMDKDESEMIALRRRRITEQLYKIACGRWDYPGDQLKAISLYLKLTGGHMASKVVNVQVNT